MTASNDKTLYDKTIARRLAGSSRRTRRVAVAAVSLGAVAVLGAASLAPAQAQVRTTDIGGFTSLATAAPLKIEIYEPVIPIPTEPQAEFDVSYTKVAGESGPTTTARASSFWPGSGLGEGAKTFGDQLGLPAAITAGGYPVQVNAQYPGENAEQVQEPGPGMYQRVKADGKTTTAIAAYSFAAPADGDAGDGEATETPLQKFQKDPLGVLQAALGGAAPAADGTNPLGALATLVNISGVTSVSTTAYDTKGVKATSTSKVGEISLLLGLVKMNGIEVVTKTTGSVDGGITTSQVVNVGGLEIAGQKFTYGPDGFTAAGTSTPVPVSALGSLLSGAGVSFDVPQPIVTKDGLSGGVEAQGMTVTLDLKPLKAVIPSLSPLLDPVSGLVPDTGTQLDILKGVIGGLNNVAPKLVLRMGASQTAVTVVPPFDMGTEGETSTSTSGDTPTTTDTPATTADPAAGDPGTTAGGGGATSAGEIPPAVSGGEDPITSADINPLAGVPGLPPLGSVPMWLILGGLLLGAGVGWYLRNAGFVLFGGRGAGNCLHGLKAGIPDLRKA